MLLIASLYYPGTKDEVLGKRDLIITVFSKLEEVHISLLTLLDDDYEGRKSWPALIKVQSIQFFLGVCLDVMF